MEQVLPGFHLTDAAQRALDTCVHCGLCLPSCPTYREQAAEPDSPRGRIYLIKAAAEGRVALDADLTRHLDLCLGCLACQTACPSGVPYGVILDEMRREVEEHRPPASPARRWLKRWLLREVLVQPALLALALRLGRWAHGVGLVQLAARLGLVPAHLPDLAATLPEVPARSGRAQLPTEMRPEAYARSGRALLPAVATATGSAGDLDHPGPRVALLLGCIQDVLFAGTNVATARVLLRHGCEVAVPGQQTCCGALHTHAGDAEAARNQARRTIGAFAASAAQYVVVNAAGCGAHMKGYGHLLSDDPLYAERAAAFSRQVRDLTELLDALQAEGSRPDWQPGPGVPAVALTSSRRTAERDGGRVGAGLIYTYQDPCHLAHGQRVRQQPRRLLDGCRAPGEPGAGKRVECGDDSCCGSAGFYNLLQGDMARQVLDRKMAKLAATGATLIVTANPGCLLQLRAGVTRAGLPARVEQIADVLEAAYAAADGCANAEPAGDRPTAAGVKGGSAHG